MLDLLYTALGYAGARLGFSGSAAAGAVLGQALWTVLPGRRRETQETIALRLGLGRQEATELAKLSFCQNCQSFAEILLTRAVDWHFVHDRLTVTRPDLLRALIDDPDPAVMTTAHLGSWELMVGLLHLFIPRRAKQVVVRRSHDAALNRFMLHQRSRPSVEIVEHRNAAAKVLQALRRGGVTAFLVDHNCTRDEALFLPFLGRMAAVNVGPALMAVRSKAVVWPVFLTRDAEGGGRYTFHLEPPLRTAQLEGSLKERIAHTAAFYTQAVEQHVRACPAQWFWMHRRWKTQPEHPVLDGLF